eukprot:488373-Rhodomonas_salina.2
MPPPQVFLMTRCVRHDPAPQTSMLNNPEPRFTAAEKLFSAIDILEPLALGGRDSSVSGNLRHLLPRAMRNARR